MKSRLTIVVDFEEKIPKVHAAWLAKMLQVEANISGRGASIERVTLERLYRSSDHPNPVHNLLKEVRGER